MTHAEILNQVISDGVFIETRLELEYFNTRQTDTDMPAGFNLIGGRSGKLSQNHSIQLLNIQILVLIINFHPILMQLLNNPIWRQILEQQLQNIKKQSLHHIILINIPNIIVQAFLEQVKSDEAKTSPNFMGIDIKVYQNINNQIMYVWQFDSTRESTIHQITQYFSSQREKYELDVKIFCYISYQHQQVGSKFKDNDVANNLTYQQSNNDENEFKMIKILKFYEKLMNQLGQLNIQYFNTEKFNKLYDTSQFELESKVVSFPPSLVIVNNVNKGSNIGLLVRSVAVMFNSSLAFIKNNQIAINPLIAFYLFNDTKPLNKENIDDNCILCGEDHAEVINTLIEESQQAKELKYKYVQANEQLAQKELYEHSFDEKQSNYQIQQLLDDFKNKLDQVNIVKLEIQTESSGKQSQQQIGARFKRGNLFKQ